jgi:outer membrane protein assembly factor BamA
MYTTSPNEGSTYGIMPVFLSMDDEGAVHTIFAPSVSWNSAAGVNTTFRYYLFSSPVEALSLVAAISTHINRTLWLTYYNLPTDPGDVTFELVEMIRRNLFFRFFGFGPDSLFSGQSSYTRTTLLATARLGLNLPEHFNIGARLTLRGDRPEAHAIFNLPLTQDAYPGTPGLGGASQVIGTISLRYDTREVRDYSDTGVFAEALGAYHQGMKNCPSFWQASLDGRGLYQETSYLQTAGRVYWNQVFGGGANVPFYYQSSLGGELLLRGFPEDRFIDKGAWEVEVEQRIRLLQTHFFDATADWRIDPFVGVGQVYGSWSQIVDHPRPTIGIGLRAWVHPNVLGRVDLAWAGEGIRAYVVLGYPY